MYNELLKRKDVEDVITTETAVFIVHTTKHRIPVVLADKEVVLVPAKNMHAHPRIHELLGGVSLKTKKRVSANAQQLIEYAVTEKSASVKQRLAHALSGTATRASLLEQARGRRVGRGALLVPAEHARIITSYLDKLDIQYTNTRVYVEGEQ